MFAISNQQREEITTLLAALQALQGRDNKTINTKRRATLAIKKLAKSKQVSYEHIKTKV